jgi:hypothetical protein
MSLPRYRLLLLGCALAWFLLGLHAPAVHQITHHGRAPQGPLLGALGALLLAAVGALWALWRHRPSGRPGATGAGAAT